MDNTQEKRTSKLIQDLGTANSNLYANKQCKKINGTKEFALECRGSSVPPLLYLLLLREINLGLDLGLEII